MRYKQAVLGVAWAVLQPFLTMIVFTVVFNRALGVKSPDPERALCGLQLQRTAALAVLRRSAARSGVSLVGNANLLTKVYFPRLVIPISAVLAGLVDFGISFVVLLGLMAAYGIAPDWHVVFLPLFVLLAIATALAVSLWLSALNVLYRDVQYVIPFLVQLWMFVSPVIYPISYIPAGPLRIAFALNPMTGVIGGFRWALLGQQFPGGYTVDLDRRGRGAARRRPLLLQAHGAGVRRCGVGHERHRPAHGRSGQDVPHRRGARGVPHPARHARAGGQATDRAHPPPGRRDAHLGGSLGAEGRRSRGRGTARLSGSSAATARARARC